MPPRRAAFLSEKKVRNLSRAFQQIFLKRAIIARRDIKAFANSILLPVIAIGLVMLIMKLNIDPAGPQVELTFDMYSSIVTGKRNSLQTTVIPVAAPRIDSLPLQGGSEFVRFDGQGGVNNSVQMSQQLLHTLSMFRLDMELWLSTTHCGRGSTRPPSVTSTSLTLQERLVQ